MLLPPPSPLHQNNHILMSKTITEFEDKVHIFMGIVGEPQLSDENFDVWMSIDLNKTIKKKSPDNGAQVWGAGGPQTRFSQKPKFDLFFFLKPSLTWFLASMRGRRRKSWSEQMDRALGHVLPEWMK